MKKGFFFVLLLIVASIPAVQGKLERVDLGITVNLQSVSITGPDDIWLAGGHGYIAHYDGVNLTVTETPTDVNLNAIAMFDDDSGWAAGEEGTILRYQNGIWSAMGEFEDNFSFKAIQLFTTTDVLFIGYSFFSGGQVIHWDGENFEVVYEVNANLQDIAAYGPMDVWVVGTDNFRAHYDGIEWKQDTSPLSTSTKISSIAMDRYHYPVICGGRLPDWDKQEIFSYTGSQWVNLYEDWGVLLLTIDVCQSVGFAGGRDGTMLEYTIFGWQPVTPLPTSHQINDIALWNMSVGWLAGYGGTLLKFTQPSIDLILNPSHVRGGDPFSASMELINPWNEDLSLSVFLILEVYGTFYFWPSFTEDVDFDTRVLAANSDETVPIFEFTWPEGAGSGEITFWGALVDGSELLAYDREDMSWND